MTASGLSIVALAGGVGGSRFVRGLRAAAPGATLTAVVNTGDDVTLHGLRISPDVDTILYALAGVVDEARGWGRRKETFRCMSALEHLGGESWFRLGDLDLATHLRRTGLLAAGRRPSEVTAELARRLGVSGVAVRPMSDEPVETWVRLAEDGRWIAFQEFFVQRRAEPTISGVRFEGVDRALPGPGVLASIEEADLVVICPSNPVVSIGPILAVAGVRAAIARARSRGAVVASISPIIGGRTVKGPAAKMLADLGIEPTAAGVAGLYADLLDLHVIDRIDAPLAERISSLAVRVVSTDALMRGRRGEARLARALLRAVAREPAA